jgi:hypothetical protein
MTKYRLSAFAMLATLSFAVPAHAQTLGASCRKGNLASCRTLCARGFHKACAKAKGRGGPPGKAMVEMGERSLAEMQANGLIATGLVPVFPKEARCTPIASPFGSHTRYDGSIRTPKGNFGYHGGIDISLPIGTPILAISDGTVVGKRHGGRLVGNELMVRQSPADTGLPVWTFTKYKHFSRLPTVKIASASTAARSSASRETPGRSAAITAAAAMHTCICRLIATPMGAIRPYMAGR